MRTTDELAATLRTRRASHVHNIPLTAPLNMAPRNLPVGACGRRGRVVHWRPLGLERDLRRLAVLGDKHVPADYLCGSEAQRLALLQGLMDTDGYAGPGDAVEFSSTREQLALAVLWLAASLGQRPRLAKGVARLNGIDHGPKYRVTWRATRQVFALPRKARKISATWTRESGSRILVRCDPVPVLPMRCLTVDSPSSMYLITDRCLPTHNTCPGAIRKRQWANTVLPRFLTGSVEEDDDMTPEQARQLEAVYKALIVPGTTTAEEAFNLLFARVRRIESMLEELTAGLQQTGPADQAG